MLKLPHNALVSKLVIPPTMADAVFGSISVFVVCPAPESGGSSPSTASAIAGPHFIGCKPLPISCCPTPLAKPAAPPAATWPAIDPGTPPRPPDVAGELERDGRGPDLPDNESLTKAHGRMAAWILGCATGCTW